MEELRKLYSLEEQRQLEEHFAAQQAERRRQAQQPRKPAPAPAQVAPPGAWPDSVLPAQRGTAAVAPVVRPVGHRPAGGEALNGVRGPAGVQPSTAPARNAPAPPAQQQHAARTPQATQYHPQQQLPLLREGGAQQPLAPGQGLQRQQRPAQTAQQPVPASQVCTACAIQLCLSAVRHMGVGQTSRLPALPLQLVSSVTARGMVQHAASLAKQQALMHVFPTAHALQQQSAAFFLPFSCLGW